MLAASPLQLDNDVEDTLEEFYLDLVTQIHRKEERELQAHPDRVSERLEVLRKFSNEVLNLAELLAGKLREQVIPPELDQLDLDKFMDTSMLSDESTPDICRVYLEPLPNDARLSRETSAHSIFPSRFVSPRLDGYEVSPGAPSNTMDPRGLLLQGMLEDREDPEHQILTNPIESVLPLNKSPCSARKKRLSSTAEEQASPKAASVHNRCPTLRRRLHRGVVEQKGVSGDLSLPKRVASAIASRSSLRQLRDILKTTKRDWSSKHASLPTSTGTLWRYLHTLDASNHGNSLRMRIGSYHLRLHHESLLLQLKARNAGTPSSNGDSRTEVLDIMIAEGSESGNEPPISGPPLTRPALKDKIHKAKIWHTLCEKYSPGILLLIPISETRFQLSNSAIEKMNVSDVETCLKYISERREDIVRQAAAKATAILPLFEGKACATTLKLEDEGQDRLLYDMDDSSPPLELLDPKL